MKADYRLLIGRRAICGWLGITWRTVKKWKQLYNFPLIQMPGMAPIVYTGLVGIWAADLREKELLEKGEVFTVKRRKRMTENEQ